MQTAPIRIDHTRWRHREKGHVVSVCEVVSKSGKHGEVTFITFSQVGGSNLTWPAETFLRTFKPVGRKVRRKTFWEWLLEEDEF